MAAAQLSPLAPPPPRAPPLQQAAPLPVLARRRLARGSGSAARAAAAPFVGSALCGRWSGLRGVEGQSNKGAPVGRRRGRQHPPRRKAPLPAAPACDKAARRCDDAPRHSITTTAGTPRSPRHRCTPASCHAAARCGKHQRCGLPPRPLQRSLMMAWRSARMAGTSTSARGKPCRAVQGNRPNMSGQALVNAAEGCGVPHSLRPPYAPSDCELYSVCLLVSLVEYNQQQRASPSLHPRPPPRPPAACAARRRRCPAAHCAARSPPPARSAPPSCASAAP